MKLAVERREGYWELALTGAGQVEAGEAQSHVAELARELATAPARPAFLLWNLSAAVELAPETFSWMLGASALHRLQGVRVFVAGLTDAVSGYLGLLGMRSTPGRAALPAASVLRRLLSRHRAALADGAARADGHLDRLLASAEGEEKPAVVELYRFRNSGLADDERTLLKPQSEDDEDPVSSAARGERRGGPPSLGEILRELGILTREQLDDALALQRHEKAKGKLGNLLIRMGLVTDEQIFSALEEQYRRALQRLPSSSSDWKGQARETRESLLGNVLLSLGILSSDGLDSALQEQWKAGGRETLGAVLIRMGLVTRSQLFRALEKQAELKARTRRVAGPLSARLPRP